ncbi:hypothetical protein [Lachnotalea glycerini]|uniref:Uncharacterized protein n=1 Tax=Lachnotalea glycerini TaxID=1763509 RepID=A0A371JBN0_9FIRM|nr:hypothetical protein [Lachnotalea glycerini]RDY30078.1 hypothetical protein CG710_016695 [Lachnotalea glycerini]
MDMTYEDALVMPNGCVMMDEEEMTYVEGGDNKYTMTLSGASDYFAMVVAAASAFAAGSAAIQYVGEIGTFYYGAILGSAIGCLNQCKTWLESYSSSSKVKVTEYTTLLGIITGYSVALK